MNENRGAAINTALAFFYPLKNMPICQTFLLPPLNKNNMGLYSLPSSQSAMLVRPSSRGLPETLILTTNTPTEETAVPRLVQSENFYYPTMLVSTAS